MKPQLFLGNDQKIAIADRGFQYGDGCFSTMAIRQGKVCHWQYHLARFESSLARLSIEMPDPRWLYEVIIEQAAFFIDKGIDEGIDEGIVKVVITRGEGGRGYGISAQLSPNVVVTTANMPENYASLREDGIALGCCEQVLGSNPLLAGMKHLNRLEQVLIRQEIDHNGWQDALVSNVEGHVIETGLANLFWEQDGQIYTPDLLKSGVNGVMRQVVIDKLNALGHIVQVVQIDLVSLLNHAESLFISNSLMGVVPVREVRNQHKDYVYPLGPLYTLVKDQL